MWPSLPVANHIADVANWFFIGSLVVGVVSTILIVWMAGVKEAYWERDRTESAERVASLTLQGDQLRKDTAEAQARTKEAERDLDTLQRLSERRVLKNKEGFLERLKDQPSAPVEIWYLREAQDAQFLAELIASALREARWGFAPTKPIPELDPSSDEYRRGETNVRVAGGQPAGVTVVSRLTTIDAAQALSRALSRGIGLPVGGTYGDAPVPEGTLRVVIGNKVDPIFWPKGVPRPGEAEKPK